MFIFSDFVTNSYGESNESQLKKKQKKTKNKDVLNWRCLGLSGDRRQNSL